MTAGARALLGLVYKSLLETLEDVQKLSSGHFPRCKQGETHVNTTKDQFICS